MVGFLLRVIGTTFRSRLALQAENLALRRRVLHFNVTSNPTAEWTAQQIVEAFPWELSAKYLLRDNDKIYGEAFQKRVRNMGFDRTLEISTGFRRISGPKSPILA